MPVKTALENAHGTHWRGWELRISLYHAQGWRMRTRPHRSCTQPIILWGTGFWLPVVF